VLLAGEGIADYELEAALWVQGLNPQTDAETEVVLDVVDVRVRLGRLERAVRVKTEAAVAKAVAETPETHRFTLTQNALTLLAAMKMTIDQTVTADADQLERLLPPVRSVLGILAEVQAHHSTLIKGLVQIEGAVEDLVMVTGTEWPTATFTAISGFIDAVVTDLQERASSDQQAVEEVRVEAAICAVPGGDPETKRLEGYRRQLEHRL
jgi:hypothetical protein